MEKELTPTQEDLLVFFGYFTHFSTGFAGVLGMVGVGFNSINMIIFRKIGLNESINVVFFGLSVTDFVTCILGFMYIVSVHPAVVQYFRVTLYIDMLGIADFTFSEPMVISSLVSAVITAFAAIQRCLCVAIPMRVKLIFTATRAKIVIVLAVLFCMGMRSTTYFVQSLDWLPDPFSNRSVLQITFMDGPVATLMDFTLLSQNVLIITVNSILTVCTIILCTHLAMKSKWRQTFTSSDSESSVNASKKVRKTTITVVLISILYLVCSIPVLSLTLVSALNKEILDFNTDPYSEGLYYFLFQLYLMFQTINISLNIFIYYNTSSKYYETFNQIFPFFNTKQNVQDKK